MADSIEELRERRDRDGDICSGLGETAGELAAEVGQPLGPGPELPDPGDYPSDPEGTLRFKVDVLSGRRAWLEDRVTVLGETAQRRRRASQDRRLGIERFAGEAVRNRAAEQDQQQGAIREAERQRDADAARRAERRARAQSARLQSRLRASRKGEAA